MHQIATPLEKAILEQELEEIHYCLENGATADDKNHLGIPVIYDALKSNNPQVISLLIEKGANLSIPYNSGGFTPFIYACFYCSLNTIQLLHQYHKDINQKSEQGITAVHVAVQRGDLSILEWLYQNGGSLSSATNHGEIPLMIALKAKNGLQAFQWILNRYSEQTRSLDTYTLPCLSYIFEKQQPDAIQAAKAFLLHINHIPTQAEITHYMEQPGRYASSPLRSLPDTLNTALSQALFSLLKAEALSRKIDNSQNTFSEESTTPFRGL